MKIKQPPCAHKTTQHSLVQLDNNNIDNCTKSDEMKTNNTRKQTHTESGNQKKLLLQKKTKERRENIKEINK